MKPTSKHALITIVAVALLALAATVARAVEAFTQKPAWADKLPTL